MIGVTLAPPPSPEHVVRTFPCWIAVFLAIVLGGCQSAPGADVPAPAVAQAVIHGKATYLQRIALAPGATLRVQLIDSQLADTPAAVIADHSFTHLAGPPFVFALPYDPGRLRPGGMYGLHASLRDADGRLLFVTDTRVPLTPGEDDVGTFRMTMVGGDGGEPRADASPWDAARSRGIGFRAVGNEPGWLVEIGMGEAPALHAELDYGQRRLDIAHAQPLDDGSGFGATAADGTRVELRIERGACSDGMSDLEYPASAELVVGTASYHGCGRFLSE